MRHALTTVAAILLATGTAAQVTTAEQTVSARDDKERLAALNRDVAALEDLWSADFTVNAPNNTVAAGRKAVMNAFVASNVIDFSSFERQVEYVKVDGSFAVIMGLETVTSKRRTGGRTRRREDHPAPVHEHLEERVRHLAPVLAARQRHPGQVK